MLKGTHPNVKVKIFICDGLDVESNGRYCSHDLSDLYHVDKKNVSFSLLYSQIAGAIYMRI